MAWDVDPFWMQPLGAATTSAEGLFRIAYDAALYGPAEHLPDLQFAVIRDGAELYRSRVYRNVATDVADLGTITVPTSYLITGRVIDEHSQGLAGFVVHAL